MEADKTKTSKSVQKNGNEKGEKVSKQPNARSQMQPYANKLHGKKECKQQSTINQHGREKNTLRAITPPYVS